MKFLVEDDVRQLFARLCTGLAAALLAAECASWALCPALCLPLLGLFLLVGLFYSLRTGFFQVFECGLWLRTTLGSLLRPRRKRLPLRC